MLQNYKRLRIGSRTIKTALAVILSLIVVSMYGTTTSKMIFAMLGAMNAMETTFRKSLESCMTQIVGMICGVVDYFNIVRGNYRVFVILGVCRCRACLVAVDIVIGMIAEPVHSKEINAFILVKICKRKIINYDVREVAVISEIPVGISVIDKIGSAVAVMSRAILNGDCSFPR